MRTSVLEALQRIQDFLGCLTPTKWLELAEKNTDILLIDHAHCERKAAASAIHLLYRYPDKERLLIPLSQLAREELRHFEQVLVLIKKRDLIFRALTGSRYAQGLRQHMRTHEPARLIDTLIVSAFIEARSCERFYALSQVLKDVELVDYYDFLLKSEARHFETYLELAKMYSSEENIASRIDFFREHESLLITQPDSEFRFHSGIILSS